MRTTNGDLELAVLDVQPLSSVKPTYDENNDDDDDDDHGALLGDGQRHSPAYSSPRDAAKLWPQIKGLVIEVISALSLLLLFIVLSVRPLYCSRRSACCLLENCWTMYRCVCQASTSDHLSFFSRNGAQ